MKKKKSINKKIIGNFLLFIGGGILFNFVVFFSPNFIFDFAFLFVFSILFENIIVPLMRRNIKNLKRVSNKDLYDNFQSYFF